MCIVLGPSNIGVILWGSRLAMGDQCTACQCPITVRIIFACKILEPDPARKKFLWVHRLHVQGGLSFIYHWLATACRPRVPHTIWGSSGSVFRRYSARASIQRTSYADHVSVVSPGEFQSAVACVSVELTAYSTLVSAPVGIVRPNPENSDLFLIL